MKEFWSKVNICEEDGCWEWIGTINKYNRGVFAYKNKYYPAHSFAYYLSFGKLLSSRFIWQTCRNLRCCNPKHLKLTTDEERAKLKFLDLVDKKSDDECWEWKGAKTFGNYGKAWNGKNNVRAHRLSWEIFVGHIQDGMFVCHKCDNPSCVNPKHLFLGTRSDNMQDMVRKGRKPDYSGSNHPKAKFKEKDIIKIRELVDSKKYTNVEIGKMFGVKGSYISNIYARRVWKNI